jgi:hypothetical protein
MERSNSSKRLAGKNYSICLLRRTEVGTLAHSVCPILMGIRRNSLQTKLERPDSLALPVV